MLPPPCAHRPAILIRCMFCSFVSDASRWQTGVGGNPTAQSVIKRSRPGAVYTSRVHLLHLGQQPGARTHRPQGSPCGRWTSSSVVIQQFQHGPVWRLRQHIHSQGVWLQGFFCYIPSYPSHHHLMFKPIKTSQDTAHFSSRNINNGDKVYSALFFIYNSNQLKGTTSNFHLLIKKKVWY